MFNVIAHKLRNRLIFIGLLNKILIIIYVNTIQQIEKQYAEFKQ